MTSLKQLRKYLEHEIENSVRQEVADIVIQETRNQTENIIYKAYTPYEYKRTRELLNSIVSNTRRNSDGLQLEVYNDTDLINPYYDGSKWPPHVSDTGEDVSEFIPEWIIKGHEGRFVQPPRDYIEAAKVELGQSKQHIKALQESLKRKGIETIFS